MALIISPDQRRAVSTDPTSVTDSVFTDRPHYVLAVTATGRARVWATRTRDEARRVVRAYNAHKGAAEYRGRYESV